MTNAVVEDVVIRPFGEGGAEWGMTRAEMLDQINHFDASIMTTLEFQTQIIFGWIVAMFFVAHRLSRPQLIVACIFFLAISMLNLGVLASAISNAGHWSGLLIASVEGSQSLDAVGLLLAVVGNGWVQLAFILAVYSACIWWAISCRNNQAKDLGSPL